MTYEEFGLDHTHEERVNAAKAAIAFLWGTELSRSKKESNHLNNAIEKLFDFSGDEEFFEAAEELDILSLPDTKDPNLVEYGVEKLKESFDLDNTPTNRGYWVEAIRMARRASE